jgi:hypothetical protein
VYCGLCVRSVERLHTQQDPAGTNLNDRVPSRPRCDPGDPVRLVDWSEGS